jgi:hypothetical protein
MAKEKKNKRYLGRDWVVLMFINAVIAEIFMTVGVFHGINKSFGLAQTTHLFFMKVQNIFTNGATTLTGLLGSVFLFVISLSFLVMLFVSWVLKNGKVLVASIVSFIDIATIAIGIGTMYSLVNEDPALLNVMMQIGLILIVVFALLSLNCALVVFIINIIVEPIAKVLEDDEDNEEVNTQVAETSKNNTYIEKTIEREIVNNGGISEEKAKELIAEALKSYQPKAIEAKEEKHEEVVNDTVLETSLVNEDDDDEEMVMVNGKLVIKRVPFATKLERADEDTRNKYEIIRDYITKNYGIKHRISIPGDTYSAHREKYVFIRIAGKTLKVYYALDPKNYENTPIPVEVETKKKYEDVPTSLKVKSDLALRRALALVDDLMALKGVEKIELPEDEKEVLLEEPLQEELEEENLVDEVEEDDEDELVLENGVRVRKPRVPFVTKLENLPQEMKDKYNELKNYILSYGVKDRISIPGETFSLHREKYVYIRIAGKSLRVYFALNSEDYENTAIPVRKEEKKKYLEIPTSLKVKSDLSLRRAMTLVDDVMTKKGISK